MERERNERAMAPAKRGHWQCTSAAASRRATRTTSSARRTARRSSVARLALRSGWRCPWSLYQRRASSCWRKARAGRTTGRSSRARGSRRSRRAGGRRRRRRRADGGGAAAGGSAAGGGLGVGRYIRTSRRRRTTCAPRGSGARGARARRYAWLSVSRQQSSYKTHSLS